MAKLDISSCFWSLLLPPLRRHIFHVQVGDLCYAWTRLPFGWAYAPILCQSIVSALVRAALIGIIILRLVYLDDVLLAVTERDVVKGYARVVDRFKKAGFLMSPKSVSRPSKQLDLIGKAIDMQRRRVSNKTGFLASGVSLATVFSCQMTVALVGESGMGSTTPWGDIPSNASSAYSVF